MPEPVPSTPAGTSLESKTIIVTGGNAGLGFEFARQSLILKASRVIVTTRTHAKGETAVSALSTDPEVQSTNPTANIEFLELDLDDYQSGLRFSQKVKQNVKDLDLLLCNAGTNSFRYETSQSGHERIMQGRQGPKNLAEIEADTTVNCYTHFLIVLELLPLLRATATKRQSPTRLTFVGSYSQDQHTLIETPIAADVSVLDHYDDETLFRGTRRYQNSKLMMNAFVRRLATVVPASEVIVNNVCPGIVATDINRDLPLWAKPYVYVLYKLKARTVLEGGRVIMHAAVVLGTESHGKFVQNGQMDKYEPCVWQRPCDADRSSGAPFVGEPAGQEYIEKLWAEIVADIIKVDPELKVFGVIQSGENISSFQVS